MIAAAAMAASSLSVVGNANRLRRFTFGHPGEEATLPALPEDEAVEVTTTNEKEEITDKVTDPVCGMEIHPAAAAGTQEREGITYYFCSEACLEKFQADPGAYATK